MDRLIRARGASAFSNYSLLGSPYLLFHISSVHYAGVSHNGWTFFAGFHKTFDSGQHGLGEGFEFGSCDGIRHSGLFPCSPSSFASQVPDVPAEAFAKRLRDAETFLQRRRKENIDYMKTNVDFPGLEP